MMGMGTKTTRGMRAFALAATAVLAAALPAAAEEVMQDGVLHVKNGAEPAQGVQRIELEESWRVGGDDGEDFFGMISQVVVGDDGTIYLLDTRLSEVPVYSPDGERIATLSREGDGPGEVRIPSGLLLMPDGTLGIVQVFPGRIVKVGLDGSPAGEFKPGGGDPTQGGFLQLFDCVAAGADIVATAEGIAQNGPTGQIRTNFVATFDAEGQETARLWERKHEWDFTKFEFDEDKLARIDYRKVAVAGDGRIYVAPERNAYVINVYASDGSLERVIEREYAHRDRDQDEIDRLRTVLETQLRQLPNPKITISATQPDIGGIEFGPDGNLWVSTSRSAVDQPEGVFATWDVFTPDGQFLRQVSAVCDGDGESDIIMWTPGGDAVKVTGFVEAVEALQNGGAGGADEDGSAEPMEIIYMKRAGA